MTARGRVERLIERYHYPAWLRVHSELVRDVAVQVAEALRASGAAIDVEAAGAGALLHDIGKSPLLAGGECPHHELSALVLAGEGLRQLGEIARRHVVFALGDPLLAPRSLEEKVVYYADRRAGLEIMPLEERVRELARRYPSSADAILACLGPARELERELLARAALRPEEICARR